MSLFTHYLNHITEVSSSSSHHHPRTEAEASRLARCYSETNACTAENAQLIKCIGWRWMKCIRAWMDLDRRSRSSVDLNLPTITWASWYSYSDRRLLSLFYYGFFSCFRCCHLISCNSLHSQIRWGFCVRLEFWSSSIFRSSVTWGWCDHGHKHFSVLSHRRGTKSAC